MKTPLALAAVVLLAAGQALAQPSPPSSPSAAAPPKAPAPSTAHGRFSVDKSTVKEITADPRAKAALEAQLPDIPQYYGMIGDQTLVQVAPQSGGAIDDAKLKAIQAAFDAL